MRVILLLLLAFPARGETVTVAVASNFLSTFETLAEAWEDETGHEVAVASGATGLLYAQIVRGAPFDLFLAADAARPARLAERGPVRTYAVGRLALWGLDGADRSDLDGSVPRLAIANPETAPYGLAAREVMEAHGPDAETVLTGENAAQAFLFARTGNADLAFVPLAFVRDDPRTWVVPPEMHAPIRQDMVLLHDTAAARALFEWLGSADARAAIRAAGYGAP